MAWKLVSLKVREFIESYAEYHSPPSPSGRELEGGGLKAEQ
jgi:hypothetical protein